MKNKILLTILFISGIFFFLTPVNALTKIVFEEQSNGQIDTKLHFEDGFVGAIDVTFNISGNVDVKNFKFSNKITSGDYDKEFEYNKTKHTLTVRVTTGGIGTSHNLLNSKKELDLGVIEFSTTAKDDVKYKLSETAFKIVGNSWESKTVEQSHITLGDKTEFVYKVEKTTTEPSKPTNPDTPTTPDNPTKPSNPENPTDPGETDKPGDDTEENQDGNTGDNTGSSDVTGGNTTTQNNQSQSGNNNNNSNNNSNKKPNSGNTATSNGNQSDDAESNEPSDETDNTENNTQEPSKDNNQEKDEEESSFDWTKIIIAAVVLLLVVGLGIYFLVFKKNKEDE